MLFPRHFNLAIKILLIDPDNQKLKIDARINRVSGINIVMNSLFNPQLGSLGITLTIFINIRYVKPTITPHHNACLAFLYPYTSTIRLFKVVVIGNTINPPVNVIPQKETVFMAARIDISHVAENKTKHIDRYFG